VASVDTTIVERERGSVGSGLGKQWRVIVLNDDHNTFDSVASALAGTLPGVSFAQGLEIASRIHSRGLAVVWRGHRELAELYWGLLDQHGLTMAPLEQ
jgi:ATP-dependent Clp protease adaptor protein ClpS